jgi:hypothetical protein
MKRFRVATGLGAIAVALMALAPAPAHGQTFGTITLQAGEARTVSIGPTFRDLRVCNDLKSAGSIKVTIGSSWQRTLVPGQCAQDRGNMIAFQNGIRGIARITYRSLAEPSSRWYD